MRTNVLLVPVLLLAASACGDNNGTGFYATGSVHATVTDPSTSTPTDTGFDLTQQTRIDPTVPSGSMSAFTGTCQIGPTGRTLRIVKVSQDLGLNELDVTMPDWSQDSCTDCQHGSLTATVGQTAFAGTEQRGTGLPSQCTFTAQQNGSYGMQLSAQCTGLTATADARSVAVNVNLTLEQCDGPNTNTASH